MGLYMQDLDATTSTNTETHRHSMKDQWQKLRTVICTRTGGVCEDIGNRGIKSSQSRKCVRTSVCLVGFQVF